MLSSVVVLMSMGCLSDPQLKTLESLEQPLNILNIGCDTGDMETCSTSNSETDSLQGFASCRFARPRLTHGNTKSLGAALCESKPVSTSCLSGTQSRAEHPSAGEGKRKAVQLVQLCPGLPR